MIRGRPYYAMNGEVIRVGEVTHEVRFADGNLVTLPSIAARPPYVGQVVGLCLYEPEESGDGSGGE